MRLLIVVIMVITTQSTMAQTQTSGDRLYSQGLELQKTLTETSQKAAIRKFNSAKNAYDSQANKKKCDDAITVSNNIIVELRKPRSNQTTTVVRQETPRSTLTLTNEMLTLSHPGASVNVGVTTTEQAWTVSPIALVDGSGFVSVIPHVDDNTFDINCEPNNSTNKRVQTVEVKAGTLTKTVTVEQEGIPTMFGTQKSVLEFKSKGGSKSIEIYSNSDAIELDNNGQNWKVVSKPSWVSVIGEPKNESFVKKVKGKVHDLVQGANAIASDPSVVTSIMKVVAESKAKGSESRIGEIIISSGNLQVTVIVQQQ